MALVLQDAVGTDLQASAPEPVVRHSTKPVRVAVYCRITENDPSLPFALIGADLDWNDGTPAVHYPTTGAAHESSSPLVVDAERVLKPGVYTVRLTAYNNRSPVPDSAGITFQISVESFTGPVLAGQHLYGPILPRDNGSPSVENWNFNLASTNMDILASSVKMLLLTTRGERVMMPTYGTNLRRLLFDPNLAYIETLAAQEISLALAQWEPRVLVQGLAVERDPNARSVTINGSFVSRLDRQPFELNLNLNG